MPFDDTTATNTVGPIYSTITTKYGGMNSGSSHAWGLLHFDSNRSGSNWTGSTSGPNIGASKQHVVPSAVALRYWRRRQ